jgi:predicted  nucleic acid-binding Zn-ribbon protein
MDEQIVELDKRLISVEKDVATLRAEASHVREHYATKEDFARLEGRVTTIQSDLAALEARLECKFAQAETRMVRWCVGTMISLTGVFMAFIKFAL